MKIIFYKKLHFKIERKKYIEFKFILLNNDAFLKLSAVGAVISHPQFWLKEVKMCCLEEWQEKHFEAAIQSLRAHFLKPVVLASIWSSREAVQGLRTLNISTTIALKRNLPESHQCLSGL